MISNAGWKVIDAWADLQDAKLAEDVLQDSHLTTGHQLVMGDDGEFTTPRGLAIDRLYAAMRELDARSGDA